MRSSARLVQMYKDALCGHVIYLLAGDGNYFSHIGLGAPDKQSAAEFWFEKSAHAEMVLARCMDEFEAAGVMRTDGWFHLSPAEAEVQIIEIATRLGAKFHTGKEITHKAERMVAGIMAKVEVMGRNGEIKEINAQYKAYRQGQLAKGEKAIMYNAYLDKCLKPMIVHAAKLAGA